MSVTLTGVTMPDASAPSESLVNPPAFTDVHATGLYQFLMESLRRVDEQQGSRVLERFFTGPDELWARWQQKAWRATKLQNPSLTPAIFLDYLLQLVGFGSGSGKAKEAADALSVANKRKLAKLAVSFWIKRGRRDALEAAIRFVTGARPIIDDWFWRRTVLGEAILGGEGSPVDPWLWYTAAVHLYESGGSWPPVDESGAEQWVWISVMNAEQETTVDEEARQFILDIAELSRPLGERYVLRFDCLLLDVFYDGLMSWWVNEATATKTPIAVPGQSTTDPTTLPLKLPGLEFSAGCDCFVEHRSSATWRGYLWLQVLDLEKSGGTAAGRFHVYVQANDHSDSYVVEFDQAAKQFWIHRMVNGVPTQLATVTLADIPATQHLLRIAVSNAHGPLDPGPVLGPYLTTGIQVSWNGDMILETSDATYQEGTARVAALPGSGPFVIRRTEILGGGYSDLTPPTLVYVLKP